MIKDQGGRQGQPGLCGQGVAQFEGGQRIDAEVFETAGRDPDAAGSGWANTAAVAVVTSAVRVCSCCSGVWPASRAASVWGLAVAAWGRLRGQRRQDRGQGVVAGLAGQRRAR